MPRAEARGGSASAKGYCPTGMATGDRDVPHSSFSCGGWKAGISRAVAPRAQAGWLRRSSAWLCHGCPAQKRGELHIVAYWLEILYLRKAIRSCPFSHGHIYWPHCRTRWNSFLRYRPPAGLRAGPERERWRAGLSKTAMTSFGI